MKRKIGIRWFAAILSLMVMGCSLSPAVGSENVSESAQTQSSVTETQTQDYRKLVLSQTEDTITVLDAEGEKMLQKSPQRVVCLYNSLLDLWYLSGGTAVARVSGDTRLTPQQKAVPDVGSMTSPSLEKILSYEPDLVLLTVTLDGQQALAKSLKENGIAYLMCDLRSDSFGSFEQYSYLFSQILQTEELFTQQIEPVIERCYEICQQTQAFSQQPSVAILYSAPEYVKVETVLSQTGQMVEMLGAQNIISSQEAPSDGSVRMDLSFETLLARDPDYIFVVIMGDEEKCAETFRQTLAESTAWAELSAVKNDRVCCLPKEYSIYKPNAAYDEAFLYLAELLYPDETISLES